MTLPPKKTKVVCTIGPASEAPEVMEQMIRAGMDIARLNFSHGDFAGHRKVIENLRGAADSHHGRSPGAEDPHRAIRPRADPAEIR